MGTSSFLYRIWKTRLCTVPSWTQAECRLLPSAKQEPAGARELQLPRPAAPSGVCRGLKAAAPSRTLVPRDQNRRTRCPRVEIPAHWIGLASQNEPRSTPDEPCDLGRIPCRTAGRAPRLEISTCEVPPLLCEALHNPSPPERAEWRRRTGSRGPTPPLPRRGPPGARRTAVSRSGVCSA